MDGSKTSLGFLVLLSMVLFSGTSSGECGDDPARGLAGEGEEVGWVISREGDGGGVRGVSRNFLKGGAAAPTSFLSLGHLVLGGSSRLLAGSPGQNRGALGEGVMPGVWEVTLGEEGGRDAAGNAVKPPKGPARPWELGTLEPGRLGPVGHSAEKRLIPAPKSTPSRPDLCNRDPSGPYISQPLRDQRSFPAVS